MSYPGAPSGLRDVIPAAHSMRVRVEVLTLAMKPTGQTISASLIDGQVNVDADAEVTRSMTATFHDPDRQLSFDSDSPADGALYADRMLRVWYAVREPGGRWLETPIFTGPIVSYSRDGSIVSVECQGKERLALGATWAGDHHKKGKGKREVIRDCLHAEGERHFAFEKVKGKLAEGLTVPPDQQPWKFAQRIARSEGMQLFYDGFGRCRLRHPPKHVAWTFRTGDGGTIVTPPRITYDVANLKNAVRVTGKKPKGQREKVKHSAVAPAAHPFSPRHEGRGRPLPYLAEFIDDPSIDTEAEARKVANRQLDKLLVQQVTVEADTLVVPQLEESDMVRYRTDDFEAKVRLRRFTIPLTAAENMTAGYNRKVEKPRRRKRRGKRRKGRR